MSQILCPQVSILLNFMAVGPTLRPSPGSKNANWAIQKIYPWSVPWSYQKHKKGMLCTIFGPDNAL